MNTARKNPTIIVIVVIAALVLVALVAIPAWRNSRIRGHVAEALKVADTAKLVVMESATVHGGLAHIDASDLTYNAKATASDYIAKITIGADGRINLATKDTGASPDPVLVLTPSERAADKGSAPIQWSCQVVTGDPDLVPEDCRTGVQATSTPNSPANASSVAGASSSHSS
jgi:type IV pilus assembly protein PilA